MFAKLVRVILIILIGCYSVSASAQKTAEEYYLEGVEHYKNHKFFLAARSLHISLREDDSLYDAYMLLSELYVAQRKYTDGISVVDKGLEKFPNDIELMLIKAQLLRDMGKLNEASTIYRSALSLANNDIKLKRRIENNLQLLNLIKNK